MHNNVHTTKCSRQTPPATSAATNVHPAVGPMYAWGAHKVHSRPSAGSLMALVALIVSVHSDTPPMWLLDHCLRHRTLNARAPHSRVGRCRDPKFLVFKVPFWRTCAIYSAPRAPAPMVWGKVLRGRSPLACGASVGYVEYVQDKLHRKASMQLPREARALGSPPPQLSSFDINVGPHARRSGTLEEQLRRKLRREPSQTRDFALGRGEKRISGASEHRRSVRFRRSRTDRLNRFESDCRPDAGSVR